MHQQYACKEAAAKHYLLIGPYDHYGAQNGVVQKEISGHSIDSTAKLNMDQLVSQWFHYCLRNGEKPAFLQDRVALFVIGEQAWRFFPSVDKMNSDTLCYYLQPKGNLVPKQQPGKPLELSWNTRDFAGDSNSVTGEEMEMTMLLKRKQVLFLNSGPLGKEVIWNGSPVADLWLSLSVPDADLQISWWEVDSNGKWKLLSRQFQRLSLSKDKSIREPWTKDEIYHVQLKDAPWISTHMRKGSKLMLTINPLVSSLYQINYGSNKDVSIQTREDGGPVTLRVYTDADHASRILLPVM